MTSKRKQKIPPASYVNKDLYFFIDLICMHIFRRFSYIECCNWGEVSVYARRDVTCQNPGAVQLNLLSNHTECSCVRRNCDITRICCLHRFVNTASMIGQRKNTLTCSFCWVPQVNFVQSLFWIIGRWGTEQVTPNDYMTIYVV